MLRIIKILALPIIFLNLAAGPAMAEAALTWGECVTEAAEHHPDLISSREKLNQTMADKLIVQSDLLPQVTTEASGKRSEVDPAKPANKYTYSLAGEQLLFDGFKIASDVASASKEVKAAQYDYDVTSSDVRLSLRVAFVELLRANALLEVTKSIRDRRKQNLDLVELLYNAGREHKGSLELARADVAQAELEIIEARRSIELSQRRLLKELGRSSFSPVKVEGSLEAKFEDRKKPDFEFLAESTPFLNELIAKKEAARFEVKSAKANYFFPKVYANAAIGKQDNKILPGENEWSMGLKLTYPLYEGGQRIAEIKKAKSKLGQTEADEKSGRDGVIYTLQDTWTRWQDAIDTVGVRRQFLEASGLRAEITQAEYSNGLALFDNWTIIEDELSRNKKAYLNSLADTLIAEAYWMQAKGGTLENAG